MAKSANKWSAEVNAHDHPFDLEPDLFANGTAQEIAGALKKSAQDPARHSDHPYRTATSMLDLYVNRASPSSSAQARSGQDGAAPVVRALGRGKLLVKSGGPLQSGPLLQPPDIGHEFGPRR